MISIAMDTSLMLIRWNWFELNASLGMAPGADLSISIVICTELDHSRETVLIPHRDSKRIRGHVME
jgi:hypothetical protein